MGNYPQQCGFLSTNRIVLVYTGSDDSGTVAEILITGSHLNSAGPTNIQPPSELGSQMGFTTD